MIWGNVMMAVQIAAAYAFVCFLLPLFCLHPILKKKDAVTTVLTCFLASNLYIFETVYVLGYLKIFNTFTVWTVVLLPIALRLWFNRSRDFLYLKEEGKRIYALIQGEYGLRLYLRRKAVQLRNFLKSAVILLFGHKLWEWLIVGFCIVFSVWLYGGHKFHTYGYSAYDEEVHLYWVQSLIGQDMFPSGMYPHGFHNLIAVLSTLFSMNPTRVLLGFSHIIVIMVILTAYLVCRKLFSNKYGALTALALYCLTELFQVHERFQYTLPMEYGMAALFLLILGLFQYLKEKDKTSWFFIAGSVAYTLSCHFYVTIFAAAICGAFGIAYLIPIFRRKRLWGLLGAGLTGIAVSVLPFGAGLLLGYPFEQSMEWAVSVISESREEVSDTANDEGQNSGPEDKAEATKQDGDAAEKPENISGSQQKTVSSSIPAKIREALLTWCYKNEVIMYIHILLAAFAFIYGVLGVILAKEKDRYLLFVSLSLLWLLGNFLSITYHMGWPALIEVKRAVVFMRYTTITLYAVPMEFLMLLLVRCGCGQKASRFLSCALCLLVIGTAAGTGWLRKDDITYWEMQTDGAMKLCLELEDERQKDTWTVVSPVNERSSILNYGYHFELVDFVEELDRWKKDQSITIPTKEVYFVIEKYPLRNQLISVKETQAWKDRDPVSRTLVKKIVDADKVADRSTLYQFRRGVIMSKAYYWAEKYKKYYPNEMTVYYEDDEVMIYRLVQNVYCLNNLSIDYGQ